MHADILISVIEHDVRIALCNGHGADFDLRGARGNNIRDTAILEADLDIGEILVGSVDRLPQGIYTAHRRADQVENDVNIMDHHIQDDTIFFDAWYKRTQTTAFDQPWLMDDLFQFLHGAIKTLHMSNMEDDTLCLGEAKEFTGFLQR